MNPYENASDQEVERAYEAAKNEYARLGVDVERAIDRCLAVPISLHC